MRTIELAPKFQDSDFAETLKTQNQHEVDSYAFSEVEHLCQ